MASHHSNHHADHHRHQPPEGAHQTDRDFALKVINDNPLKNRIVTRAPEEPFRLSFLDVTCLIVNRTIGTGIFTAPAVVMRAVKSPGVAILLWLFGCLYGVAGAHVFLEYGLNVPRFVIDGIEQSVPRSGGELHYLQYIFPWPRYRDNTVILIGVLFGISFICVGNMASNCIDCAMRILEAATPNKEREDFDKGVIYGIAIAIATVTCFIHAFSRRGGILLNNGFAIFKVGFLVFIIVSCWVVAGGWSGINGLPKGASVEEEVTSKATDPNGATEAFLAVIFAFFGFDQPSYVLGEVKNPRKTLKKSMWWGLGIVSVLYVAVNICFMIVVPSDVQVQGNVALAFFDRVFDSNIDAKRTTSSLLAMSSFGNIVVWTYTAARMKQEIAKQCFIPFSLFFGNNRDVSLGRLLLWLENKFGMRRISFINPANHQEKTPVGALILHLVACIILMMATYGMTPTNAYSLLAGLFSYILAAWFGLFLSVGLLILHFKGPPPTPVVQTQKHAQTPADGMTPKTWNEMIEGSVNPKLGVIFACIYLVGNLFPVIMSWVPPSSSRSDYGETLDWYMVPVFSWTVLAFSGIWFLGFVAIASYRSRVGNKTFVYDCQPEFEWVAGSPTRQGDREDSFGGDSGDLRRRGGFIMTHETITKAWEAKETSELLQRPGGNPHHHHHLSSVDEEPSQHQPVASGPRFAQSDFANTDFAGIEMGNLADSNQHRGQG